MRSTTLLVGALLSSLAFVAPVYSHDDDPHHSAAKPDHAEHGHAAKGHAGHEHDGHASLGAHEHGVATLNLVLDGGHLVLEFDSPAANIVGFEYVPTSEQDIAAAQQARQRLMQAQTLFTISPEAGCSLQKVETHSPLFEAASVQGHKHEHEHEHEHNDDGHGEQHDQHAAHEEHGAHADIAAQFHYDCTDPQALKRIDVGLFEAFPATEKLLLQAITPTGQQGSELTRERSVIRF